jgi:hypothetical protein
MAAVVRLDQTLNWAKRRNLPPVRQRNRKSRSREYLTADEIERMILATRQVGGRVASRENGTGFSSQTGRNGGEQLRGLRTAPLRERLSVLSP